MGYYQFIHFAIHIFFTFLHIRKDRLMAQVDATTGETINICRLYLEQSNGCRDAEEIQLLIQPHKWVFKYFWNSI